jgi:hypothetical protein
MRGVMLKFDFDPTTGPTSIKHPDDLPWTLQGLATWLRPEAATWRNLAGHTIDLNQVTDWAVDRLEQETARLREIRTTGGKLRKDAKHIMRFTCGGAHLFQGVSYAVGRGFGSPRCREVLREQTELLLWRREAELLAYREALRERPDLEVTMLVQQAKFLGHWNESVHKALILGLDQPDEAARAGLEKGLQQLVETVRLLQAAGAYQRMDRLRLSPGQDLNIYLDLVGDSCHALRGLRLATAQDTLRW